MRTIDYLKLHSHLCCEKTDYTKQTGFGIAFFSSMLDIPYPEFSTHFDFGHSSMSVINFEQNGKYVYPKVLQVSNDAHLYREGLMAGYHNHYKF